MESRAYVWIRRKILNRSETIYIRSFQNLLDMNLMGCYTVCMVKTPLTFKSICSLI